MSKSRLLWHTYFLFSLALIACVWMAGEYGLGSLRMTPIVENQGAVGRPAAESRWLAERDRQLAAIHKTLGRVALLGIVLAAVISYYLSRLMSRPIEEIKQAAERYARGDYAKKVFISSPREFVDLAKAMNRMAREMGWRLRDITRQRNEREAILASMREGVLAVDNDERVIMINPAAEMLLGTSADKVVGRLVQESLRHAELQRFLAKALAGEPIPTEESLLRWPGDSLLQAECAPLRDEDGRATGLLLVINDVTRLHKLENIRREFVANVSHELRTPITSIKGFVETLRDGAMDDPENAERFLEIINRQADRLNAIIEDLLALSRLERDDEVGGIATRPCSIKPLIEMLIQHFSPRVEEKEIRINLDCAPEMNIKVNSHLLEQAIGNLLDNAIKYSAQGQSIKVESFIRDSEACIAVSDEGCGIAAQHLPRLFERFYRVDTARSREVGGTGLGLSIVKHIAQAHGGHVSVESEPGKGSTFTIHMPKLNGSSAVL